MTIRVLHIIPTFVRGGAEKQLTLLATGLPRDRFDVHVCALTHGGPLEADLKSAGVPVRVIGKSWKIDLLAYRRLKSHIRDVKPDIVHTWLFAANAYGRTAAKSVGVKRIVAGERCVDQWKSWPELLIDRHLACKTDAIVANSEAIKNFYGERGVPHDKFVLIPNGVPPFSENDLMPREELARLCNVPADSRFIGAVCRLWPQKRVKDLIWAAELFRIIRPNCHLVIIGDGPQRWRLERYRDQVDIANHVHFLGERNDVPRILPNLDCLWLGSGYEGQSNAILEAMAAGVPVVATDIPGNRDLVIPGETGCLVPVGDRAGFARITNQIFERPDLAARFKEASQQRIADHFSVDQMVSRHIELYERLM